METATEQTTLESIRKARNLSLKDAADLLASTLGENSRTPVSYHYIEKHGTTKYAVRRALASMYKIPSADLDRILDQLPPRVQSGRS